MDRQDITSRVRRMYEAYPYPTKLDGLISDLHPGLMLSYLEGVKRSDGFETLDAGCGTGAATLGTAFCNPGSSVTAVDMNRSALAMLSQEVSRMGLLNVTVCESDLHTLVGVPIPPDGFDFILSSGVIHHMASPLDGLRRLREVLGKRGVIRLMVYCSWGRHHLYRLVEALNLIHPDRTELRERLEVGREFVRSLVPGPFRQDASIASAVEVDDAEFVDRYLNLQDVAYTSEQLFELVDQAGLQFLRWYEPRHWRPEAICTRPELLDHLSPRALYELIAMTGNYSALELILCHKEARPRQRLPWRQVRALALSPQVVVTQTRQSFGFFSHQAYAGVSLRNAPARLLDGVEKKVVDLFSHLAVPTSELLERLGESPEVDAAIEKLRDEEILYAPV